jgi:2-polyprenyl-3-methyl-5-hydroxy-6-metoxy-1,4-benzoquinol methylase
MNLSAYPNVNVFYNSLSLKFPYFSSVVERQYLLFGLTWLSEFENDLEKFFGNDKDKITKAVLGYGKFALDSMKLQVLFQKTQTYINKSYAEASQEVYQNREYMFDLYLPGIFLSHYLWRHHYKQHVFFVEKFLPLIGDGSNKIFYDIGVGTGFYSKEILLRCPRITGQGFDLSPFSLEHTLLLLDSYGLKDRYIDNLRDITIGDSIQQSDFIVNIEVLEHLEDPQSFLYSLAKMLKINGYGLISAAINAPNSDHIYLYKNHNEVVVQLENAGFEVIDMSIDEAYEPRTNSELVPVNAAFIIRRVK